MANGWELRELNTTSVWHWLNQIPNFGDILNRTEYQRDVPAKRSDLIRLSLIKHFGGVYIDYTTIMTQPLDWLFDIRN
jgi:mannosyltransferase OCH1-like enzyme